MRHLHVDGGLARSREIEKVIADSISSVSVGAILNKENSAQNPYIFKASAIFVLPGFEECDNPSQFPEVCRIVDQNHFVRLQG